MEVLIKDSNDGISYIVLISGYTEREYYIQRYCDHNNIKYLENRHPNNNEIGLIMNKIEMIVSCDINRIKKNKIIYDIEISISNIKHIYKTFNTF